jgi:hypothetical protein
VCGDNRPSVSTDQQQALGGGYGEHLITGVHMLNTMADFELPGGT